MGRLGTPVGQRAVVADEEAYALVAAGSPSPSPRRAMWRTAHPFIPMPSRRRDTVSSLGSEGGDEMYGDTSLVSPSVASFSEPASPLDEDVFGDDPSGEYDPEYDPRDQVYDGGDRGGYDGRRNDNSRGGRDIVDDGDDGGEWNQGRSSNETPAVPRPAVLARSTSESALRRTIERPNVLRRQVTNFSRPRAT
jgi:hypothetical protein